MVAITPAVTENSTNILSAVLFIVCHQLISEPLYRYNMLRGRRLVFYLFPQMPYVYHKAVFMPVLILTPCSKAKRIVCDDPVSVFPQLFDKDQFFCRKRYGCFARSYLSIAGINGLSRYCKLGRLFH